MADDLKALWDSLPAEPASTAAPEDLQALWNSTPGGAATAKIKAPKTRPLDDRQPAGEVLSDIGGATGIGAGLGLVAPQIMQGLGGAMKGSGMPMLQSVGAGLEFMGRGARAAGPGARVLSGAFSGFGSETAGKTAEALGAGPVTAEAARLVGGGLTPDAVRKLATVTTNVLSHYLTGGMTASATRTLAGQIHKQITAATGQPLTEYEKAYVDKLIADVQGSSNPGEALARIGENLRAGAGEVAQTGETRAAELVSKTRAKTALDIQRETQLANQRLAEQQKAASALHTEATTTLNNAETAARAELAAAKKNAAAYDPEATYLTGLKDQTLKAARQTRLAIGNERPLGNTNIGTELRDAAVAREGNFRKNASDAYNEGVKVVNANVAKLENGGITIDQNPAFKKIVLDLRAQLVPGKNNKSVAEGYKKLLDELTGGGAAEGAPIVTSYNSVDQTRRLLGDSFGGLPVEGYKNIDIKVRQDLYKKIRDLQVNFGGERVAKLLTDYADSRPELAVFGSKAGQQLTGLDRNALTQFATDPAKMPAYFFKTPTSFQHLVELVGDKALATQAGLDHITAELASKDTEAKVRAWMTTNRNMLDAVPGSKVAVDKYAAALGAAEKTNASIDLGIKDLAAQQAKVLGTGTARAANIRQGGGLQSNELANQATAGLNAATTERNALIQTATTAAEAENAAAATRAGAMTRESTDAADTIWNQKSASPQFNARNLITSGNAKQWELVAPIIKRSPTGTQDVYEALQQTLADKLSSGSVKGTTQLFNETISPAMVQFGMLSLTDAKRFAQQLAVIESQRVPPPEELGAWRRRLLQAVGGHVSSLAARGARAGFQFASDIPSYSNALANPQENKNQLSK